MNPTAIYSKSGKGVQEASGKTSLLKRPDRAVLSAIDGRATLADVAQKVGKSFDPGFQQLIRQLDRDGFIREVSAGSASAAAPARPAAKPAAAKPAAKAPEPKGDLDFSSLFPPSKPAAPTRPGGPPSAPPSVPPKEQESALFKARQAAEAKAQAERERARLEAEAKVRVETEDRLRLEAEEKIKAAQRAAAEAKVKAEAEAAKAEKEAARAREEAERLRQEAEQKAREEAERLRREAEEHARKVREEAERQAKEEAERMRRQLEEERRRIEAERKRLEEQERKEQEERAARRRREQEEEERERAQREARRKKELEDEANRAHSQPDPEPDLDFASPPAAPAPKAEPPADAPAPAGGFSDDLLADLEAFTNREEDERKAKAEADARAKAQAEAARAKEEAARREKEDAARHREEREAQRRREEEEARGREEALQARMRDEEERRRQEAEARRRKAKEEDARAARAEKRSAEVPAADAELLAARQRAARQAMASARPRQRRSWSKAIAGVLAVLLVAALAVAHVMPIHVQEFERAATEALGRTVRIGSGRLWLFTGPQLRFENVSAGEGIRAERVIAHPDLLSLFARRKGIRLLEIEGLSLPQAALGEALFARLRSDRFSVSRIALRGLQLPGELPLPQGLESELALGGDGTVRAATLRGPEGLVARLSPNGAAFEFDLTAASFTLPVAPAVSLAQFAMKGAATREGMRITEWDGALFDGTVSGTAAVRWGGHWSVEGVITARGINAAVFAPALLSDGRAEGTGKFSMAGADPGKLGAAGRIEGRFTVNRGVLGSFDLSRAIQTGGRQAQGRTQFAEMNGYAVYEDGAVALRNVTIGAGALNAGASADIAASGALSGRIVADVRTAAQTLRATLLLGGTLKEPQVRN